MVDLLKELEAVVGLAEKATPGPWRWSENGNILGHMPNGYDETREVGAIYSEHDDDSEPANSAAICAAVHFIRTHHAEIAETVRDAERWRALHWAQAPMVTVTGSQLAHGIRPGDYAVPWDWPVTSKTRIRMIVMNNSAREAGE